MSLRRRLAPLLLLLAFAAAPAAAASLPLADLLALSAEGVGEPVLLSMARSQGLAGPLGTEQVLEMKKAGWSDQLMAALVELAARGGSPAAPAGAGVTYYERDGAVVAHARGEPDETPPTSAASPAAEAPAPAPQVVVLPPAAPPAPAPEPARDSNGHPVGAVHGWQGSTVFLPARFGGANPSAFGRTIVDNGPAAYGYAPYAAPAAPYGYTVPLAAPAPRSTTVIRTSRGTRRIPN